MKINDFFRKAVVSETHKRHNHGYLDHREFDYHDDSRNECYYRDRNYDNERTYSYHDFDDEDDEEYCRRSKRRRNHEDDED
ncbi:MAG: hypothetical protein IGS39_26670 [Calothrix sp. C42_A2020_038]|nr:hypothetical protein [Calothrix sp. C42_A2020_038]